MNDLVSVGGICFVAVEPEKGNANTRMNTDPHGPAQTEAESPVLSEAAGGKRKNRPRGERSRKEQQRAASRHYYREHKEYYRAKQAAYRQEHREELREYHRKYYAENREYILNVHRYAYRKRRKGKQ